VGRDVKFMEKFESRKYQESLAVVEDNEKEAPKDDKHSKTFSLGIQTSGGEELSPSISIRRPCWLLQTLRDVGEAPMSLVRERIPSRKFSNYMEVISRIVDVDPSSF
jgi:hypothetical protein